MEAHTAPRHRLPRLSIALVSACALAYEILLMRLFSITQWHHFAYMIISLALLGYGASGSFLSVAERWLLPRFRISFIANVLLFGSSTLLCYLLAQQVSFNAETLLWAPIQWLKLLGIYLLLALPFFFAANCIALALSNYRQRIAHVYASDLFGAGIGSLGIIALLFAFMPSTSLQLVSALALAAAAAAWFEMGNGNGHRAFKTILLLLLPILPLLMPMAWTAPELSPYKGLSQSLQIEGTSIIDERSSPLGLLSVVQSHDVPLRYAPGLSLHAQSEPPEQLGVFTDGDSMSAITRYSGKRDELAWLDQVSWALPYHLKTAERVLVLGAGGGSEVLQALYHGAGHIDAVELNEQMATLVDRKYADFAGHLYQRPEVRLHIAEARGFVTTSDQHYDLIQLAMLDSFAASSAGLYALSENYLYTVEAMQAYLERLDPGGYVAISRWLKLPPRDTLKLFATAVEAMKRMGIEDPAQRLMLIRGWQTSTLLIKNGNFNANEIRSLRNFSEARGFDLAYYPGMTEAEANRYNILRRPYFFEAAVALLSAQSERYRAQYKFDLTPATDDRPYFFKFFKWSTLAEIMSLRGEGGLSLLESGYLILMATLLQAAVVSVVLILLPLWFHRRCVLRTNGEISRLKVMLYFFAIGLAFLFLEIAFIQRFILFLSHPLYAAAVVLTAFLIFAGAGSAWSRRLRARRSGQISVTMAVAGIILLGLAYLWLLDGLFSAWMSLPVVVKIPIAILLIAPLAFCMGMPFPLALTELGGEDPSLIPWAWAVNGCASVLSAVLATLLAIHFGFSWVVIAALSLYTLAALSFPQRKAD